MDSNPCALLPSDKKSLAETRVYTNTCQNKIAKDKANFADKSGFGLWWDAKGFFNFSDVGVVTDHMEKYRKIYEEIHTFLAQVEKGDAKSYDRLLEIYNELQALEEDASTQVKDNNSKSVCSMLTEFLDGKFKLDHSLKQVECIVLKQKMTRIERRCDSALQNVSQMSEKMDRLIDENRAVRQESDEKLRRVLEEAEARYEARMEEIRRQNEELKLEAEARYEVRMEEMRRQNEELKLESERRSEAIRLESEERLKQAVQEANERSEARMQEMAEQNRANLQKMMKMLENLNF